MIIAIDPSLSRTAVVRGETSGVFEIATFGSTKTGDSTAHRFERYREQVGEIMAWIGDIRPDSIYIEGYSFGSNDANGRFITEYGALLRDALLRLTHRVREVPPTSLKKFASGKGRLVIENAGEIPEVPKEPPVRESRNGAVKATGPWRKVNLDTLFEPGKTIRKALANADIDTVGQLADWTTKGKALTDIEGIGPGKAEDIEETMVGFWKHNPEAAEEVGA